MNVLVTVEDGRHYASVPFEGEQLPCCTPGHDDPEEAARHALKLTQAIRRKTDPEPGGAGARSAPRPRRHPQQ